MKGMRFAQGIRRNLKTAAAVFLAILVISPGMIAPGAVSAANTVPVISRLSALEAPASPSTLTASAVSATQVILIWVDASSNETGFRIERATDVAFSQNLTTINVAANSITYTDNAVAPATTYHYRVFSIDATGSSPASNTAAATTPAGATSAPSPPSSLTATVVSAAQVNLSWVDTSNNETGFKIERATDAAFSLNLISITVAVNATTYTDTGTAGNTAYFYHVMSFNTLGTSPASNMATAATPAGGPSGLTAAALGPAQVYLSWLDNSNVETGFRIERAADTAFTLDLTSSILNANTSNSTDSGVVAGTTYYYRIFTLLATGESPASNTATVTTPSTATSLTAPVNLAAAVVSERQVNLTWTDTSQSETGFKVERATDTSFSQNLVSVTLAANTTSYSDMAVTASTAYYYRVLAFNTSSNSMTSNTASAITPGSAPTAPNQTVTSLVGSLDANGFFTHKFAASSDDDNAMLIINAGTRVAGTNGMPLSQLTITRAPASPPADPRAVGAVYHIGPNGAKFDLPVTIAITYDISRIPLGTSDSSLYIALWDATAKTWNRLDSIADTPNKSVTAMIMSSSSISIMVPDTTKPAPALKTAPAPLPVPPPAAKPSPAPSPSPSPVPSPAPSPSPSPKPATAAPPASPARPLMPDECTPAALKVISTGVRAELAWDDNCPDELGYLIERSTDGLTWYSIGIAAETDKTGFFQDKGTYGKSLPARIWAFFFGGLDKGIKYYYRVKAYNSSAESKYSNVDAVTAR